MIITTKAVLTLNGAKLAAGAAMAIALENDWEVALAIVDEAGHLLYAERQDGASVNSANVAAAKARTAAMFRRPSKWLEDIVTKEGRIGLLHMPNAYGPALPVEGGVPLFAGTICIGAIGVSGATSEQDAQIGRAAANALEKREP